MRLIIVSGLSGAGKSAALHMLEDLDYYCIDNIPVELLPEFALNIRDTNASADGKIAIGTDARAGTHHISLFPSYLSGLRASGIDAEVLFLSADISVILKRYSETRRKHPLTRSGLALRDAIERETSYLAPIAECADLTIDTSQMSVHDLRGLIAQRIGHNFPGLSLLFQSFGFKHGIPGDSDYIFDVRCLPNPHWKPHLRAKTGLDDEVMAYLEAQPAVGRMLDHIRGFLETWLPEFQASNRSYITVSIGCTGGQHRSVYMVERLADFFRDSIPRISIRHSELNRNPISSRC